MKYTKDTIPQPPDKQAPCLPGHKHRFRILQQTSINGFPAWQCLYCKHITPAT